MNLLPHIYSATKNLIFQCFYGALEVLSRRDRSLVLSRGRGVISFLDFGMALGMALFLEYMENSHFHGKCGNLKIPVIGGPCVN